MTASERSLDREITPREVYLNRRTVMRGGVVCASAVATAWLYRRLNGVAALTTERPAIEHLIKAQPSDRNGFWVDEAMTPRASILNYNNFYEFSTDKDGVAEAAAGFETDGLEGRRRRRSSTSRACSTSTICARLSPPEERVYRMRCVEAWSMVIPWAGLPLVEAARRGRADERGEVRRVPDAARSRADAGPEAPTCSSGRTSRACGSTRRCTRWRCSRPGCTARSCRRRTARRCAWSRRGSTASRASSRSSRSRWPTTQPPTTLESLRAERVRLLRATSTRSHDHPRWSQATEQRIGEIRPARDADVQRLRRAGREPLRGDGSRCPTTERRARSVPPLASTRGSPSGW